MSKALELIRTLIDGANEYEKETGNTNPTVYLSRNNLLKIEQALQRLESIDNAEPSEALECLEALEQDIKDRIILAEDRQLKLCEVIKQALIKAEKEHNSVTLLMQELDCKDFADLRKYARCGYEKLNSFKDSKEIKIEIPESGLMDYNPVKHYLKWEDLEFTDEKQTIKVLLNGEKYFVKYKKEYLFGYYEKVEITNGTFILCTLGSVMKQFFNDLHLERVLGC